jgi:hypothetical protein
MSDEGTPGLTLADLLSGRDGGRVERYRAVLSIADDAAIVAVGWGTVDVQRTLRDLGHTTDSPARDEPLGAKGVLISEGDLAVLVLEPVTEGRLAACLARHGEGICALYIAASEPSTDARVRPDSPRFGPFVVEVGPDRIGGGSATLSR